MPDTWVTTHRPEPDGQSCAYGQLRGDFLLSLPAFADGTGWEPVTFVGIHPTDSINYSELSCQYTLSCFIDREPYLYYLFALIFHFSEK